MSKSKSGGLNKPKGRRQGKLKAVYKNQFLKTEKNKTKKVVRHFKSNPKDEVAEGYLSAKGYKTDTIQRTAKGRKVEARS
jgi:hypothetical protein